MISFLPEGAGHVVTIRDVDLAHGRQETAQFHQERYALVDYPRTSELRPALPALRLLAQAAAGAG